MNLVATELAEKPDTESKTGPQHLLELMEGTGSRDGRDVIIELDNIRNEFGFERLGDGRYALSDTAAKAVETLRRNKNRLRGTE